MTWETFQDHVAWYRAFPTPDDAWEPATDISATLQNLKRHRATQLSLAESDGKAWKIYDDADTRLIEIGLAEALIQTGIKVRAKDFSVSLTSRHEISNERQTAEMKQRRAETKLFAFEDAAADRLYAGLQLARTSALAPALEKDGFLFAEIDQLLEMFEHVNERLGQLLTIRDAQIMLGKLLSILSDHNENASLIQHIKQSMQELFDHVVHLRSSFEDLPYPFDHARPDISMADYLLKELPDSQNPVALYEAADTIGHALPSLQARVTGRLCQLAECVETFFGLNLLDDPPDREEDLPEGGDHDE